jgi:hypothetical protein
VSYNRQPPKVYITEDRLKLELVRHNNDNDEHNDNNNKKKKSLRPSGLGKTVTLLNRIREDLVSNIDWNKGCKVFSGFPQLIKVNAG